MLEAACLRPGDGRSSWLWGTTCCMFCFVQIVCVWIVPTRRSFQLLPVQLLNPAAPHMRHTVTADMQARVFEGGFSGRLALNLDEKHF